MGYRVVVALAGAASLLVTGVVQKQPKWSSTIKMVHEDRINASPDSLRGRSFGSATWKAGDTPDLSVVDLTFTYGGQERDLSWAILFGRCRSASLPVLPISAFPELEVTGGGAARATANLQMALPTSGQYHVDIYSDRIGGEEAVVACGDFKYSPKG